MTHLLRGQAFVDLVLSYRHTAFRLETRDRYQVEEETEPLRRFLAGTPDYSWNADWAAMIRRRTAAGQRMERVRVVTEPHSDYTRFLLDLARVNAAAGEDIRYLPRHLAASLDLPDYDFWLIDSTRVAVLRFDSDDVLLGAELLTEPHVAAQHREFRNSARVAAIPLAEYAP